MSIRKLLFVPALLLVFISCRKDKTEGLLKEKEFDLSGFTQVYTGEKINLIIEQDANFRIKANGPRGNVDKLDVRLTDNDQTLDISYAGTPTSEVVDVIVTMPHLGFAYMTGDVTATVRGFNGQVGNVGLTLSGKAKVKAHDGATIFSVDVTGNSELNLNGFTASLAGEVSLNGVINAYGLTATRVYISTMQQAKAYVKPTNIFFGSATGDSRIFYKGDPQDKELETSGNGQIIKE